MNSTCTAVRVAMGDRPHSPLQDVTAGVKEFCQALQSARHAIFVVGAGISTNCGIPDFRSPGSGVYDQVMDAGLCQGAVSSSTTPSLPFELLPDPESLFEVEYFRENPAPFYHFIRTIMPTEMELAPSIAHEMLKRLEVTKLTKRVFTQNIDGLELDAGLKRVSFCHGNLRHFICLNCRKKCDMGGKGDGMAAATATAGAAGVRAAIVQGSVPQCPKCDVGVLKPGIVFFGEKMPAGVGRLLADHLAKADLVVVMGTSLQVAPLSKLIPELPQGVTKVLINREAVRSRVSFDLELLGDCDAICRQIMQQLWPGDANSSSVANKSETQSVGATKGTPSSDGASSDATRAKRRRCGEHGR